MNKKIIILVFCAVKLAHAQQLSPIQMQKLKADFDAAVKAKKFDAAQTFLNQIEQGGRRAEAQKLMVDLAQARQKEAEAKKLEELHKGHTQEAEKVMLIRKQEAIHANQLEGLYKSQKAELEQKLKRTEKDLYETEYVQREQAMEIRKLKQQHLKEIEQLKKQLLEKK